MSGRASCGCRQQDSEKPFPTVARRERLEQDRQPRATIDEWAHEAGRLRTAHGARERVQRRLLRPAIGEGLGTEHREDDRLDDILASVDPVE
jgi:hypothetical protein